MRRRLLSLFAVAALAVAALGFPASAGAGLGNPRTSYLAANTATNPSGALTDGPSVQIGNNTGATTWVVSGGVLLDHSAVCQLWDGTTIVASGYLDNDGSLTGLTGFLVEAATANLKISCADGTATMIGGTGSWVTAVKVN